MELGFFFQGGAGDWGFKARIRDWWFETCAFLFVAILFLSFCFPKNMVPFFLMEHWVLV